MARHVLQPDNRETLQLFVQEKFKDTLFVIVSNREPYVHFYEAEDLRWTRSVGGLITALDPVMRTVGGLWVAHGAGEADADVADEQGRLAVPPDDSSYTLQRVWLSKADEEGYYYGFANQALWPLCHNAYTRPVFQQAHWESYRTVNEKFADAVASAVGDREDALIFVQDYHFALLPRMIKERIPSVKCAQFWHIPWPNPEVFSICPWRREILDGMLGNDLLAFHLQNYCANFLDTVGREVEARRDQELSAAIYNQQTTFVLPFPISVDYEQIARLAGSEECNKRMEQLKRELRLGDKIVMVGIDRMDYTKGIPDRIRAVDVFLQKHPECSGKFVLVQVATPSRQHIPQYKALNGEVQSLTEEVNWRHSSGRWSPIVTVARHMPQIDVVALFKLADLCCVSSLQDGMNLVAKEFVAARTDERGVLLLSRFAGARNELAEAMPINPYNTDRFANHIYNAINMPEEEMSQRMREMRQSVLYNNIYSWTINILDRIAALR